MEGIFRAAWSCCSSSFQGKLVMVAWPPTTGPATPKLARSIENCSCARNSCTIASRLGYCELGKVFSTSGARQPVSGEKTARFVLVPPMSPASSITLFSFDRYSGYKYTFFNVYVEAGRLDRLIGLLYLTRKEVAVQDLEAERARASLAPTFYQRLDGSELMRPLVVGRTAGGLLLAHEGQVCYTARNAYK